MKKKITFFHPSSELYGSDKILLYVVNNYPDYEKTIVLSSHGPLISAIASRFPDVTIEVMPGMPVIAKKNLTLSGIKQFLVSLMRFRHFIADKTAHQDILYFNTLAVLPVLFLSRRQRAKKIVHVHEILANSSLIHRFINKAALKYSHLCICVSAAVKRNLAQAAPEHLAKLAIVQNGIHFDPVNVVTPPGFIKPNVTQFALIGRIKPSHKGQLLLLDAIAMLPQARRDKAHFYLIGSPVPEQAYMQDEVIDRIQALHLERHVTLVPFIEQIGQVYPHLDVIVVPSVFADPFPTTVLEAMFFAKPVIGTNVGGIPEMIVNNQTGYLVPAGSATGLSAKIDSLIDDPILARRLGQNGRARFDGFFSEESFNQRYLSTLNETLKVN